MAALSWTSTNSIDWANMTFGGDDDDDDDDDVDEIFPSVSPSAEIPEDDEDDEGDEPSLSEALRRAEVRLKQAKASAEINRRQQYRIEREKAYEEARQTRERMRSHAEPLDEEEHECDYCEGKCDDACTSCGECQEEEEDHEKDFMGRCEVSRKRLHKTVAKVMKHRRKK